ncbi:MAG: aminotransferase class I/II-fold pyridoxal phosphate-dependent enzyme [Bacteroidia bacterium]|nr:aminotransferase class I/II-fold pyridoxal phosphate-dependent enzyme [Bacteroidia bacterium]
MLKKGFNTKALHEGHLEFSPDSVSVPIYQSVAYPYLDAKEAAAIFAAEKPGFTYGRWDNPTVMVFEKRMAALENMEAAIATSSGMAAILLLCHHMLEAGDEIVSSNRVYGGTFSLFDVGLKKMGIKVNWVKNPENFDEWEKAISKKNKFVYVESPSNPSLYIADLPALSKLAKSHKLPFIVDNTITSPALQQPVNFGADAIIHSTTKYICGNASSLGGIICGSKKLIEDGIRKGPMRYMGPSMAPMNAWLSIMGLETLSLRMERHCNNALAVAKFLEKHSLVESINYPGLASNPYHKLMKKQMTSCGSLMSFVLKGNYNDATRFIDSLKVIIHATHLGTSKTIVTHPASTTHSALGETEMKKAGISPTLIRFSVGLEDEHDLIEDIRHALENVAKKKTHPAHPSLSRLLY